MMAETDFRPIEEEEAEWYEEASHIFDEFEQEVQRR